MSSKASTMASIIESPMGDAIAHRGTHLTPTVIDADTHRAVRMGEVMGANQT